MIYGFSKQSHGHVTIDSKVGHGTSVTLLLPRYSGDLAEESLIDDEWPATGGNRPAISA